MAKGRKKETYDLGNGKLHDPIIGHPAMKGRRWTIDYGYDSGESYDKFQKENMKYSDLLDESDSEPLPQQVVGGVGDKLAPDKVDVKELTMGVKVEMEHTTDSKLAKEIALDHLKEDPKYYSKLVTAGLAKEIEPSLNEAPDKLTVDGHNLPWYDGITFFVFETNSGKTHIAITSGGKQDFHLQINDMDFSNTIRDKLPEFHAFLDHDGLANAIHYMKPEMVKLGMKRPDFVFSGRIWKVGQVSYISIWNDKSVVEGKKEYLNKLMKLLGLSYAKTLFEFPSNQNDYRHYDQIDITPPKSKKDTDKFMSQLHTLPPGAKKWAMKGMSLSEALLCEDPDEIYTEDFQLNWGDHSVVAVFSIFHNKYSKKDDFIIAETDTGKLKRIYTSDSYVDETINKRPDLLPGEHGIITHGSMLRPLVKTGFLDTDVDKSNLRDNTKISGRVWSHEGFYYISVWQTMDEMKQYKDMIFRIMDELGIKKNEVLFEVINIQGQLLNTTQVFFEEVQRASTVSPEEITNLLKKQHLDPKAKKVLFMLASNDKYLSVLHRAAYKMNISVAQLKNMMTVGD